jgi:hypothetical protein
MVKKKVNVSLRNVIDTQLGLSRILLLQLELRGGIAQGVPSTVIINFILAFLISVPSIRDSFTRNIWPQPVDIW